MALVVAALAVPLPAVAQQEIAPDPHRLAVPSLMFSAEELRLLESAGPVAGGAPSMSPLKVHLSAIMYYGPQQWSIWVNGQRLDPGSNLPGIKVQSVGENHVDLVVTASAPRAVRLRPNQTYVAAANIVLEGAVR